MKDQKTYYEAVPVLPTVEAYQITELTDNYYKNEVIRRLMGDGSHFDLLHGRVGGGSYGAVWYPYDDSQTRVLDKRFVAYGQIVDPKVGLTLHVGDWIVYGEDTLEFHTDEQFQRRFTTN